MSGRGAQLRSHFAQPGFREALDDPSFKTVNCVDDFGGIELGVQLRSKVNGQWSKRAKQASRRARMLGGSINVQDQQCLTLTFGLWPLT
jgi:hypothetical protein